MILEDVGPDNRRACTGLEVDEQQQRFVVSVANYLAQCAEEDSPWHPLAVRVQQEVVGFVMWGVDPADQSFWIGGLIIDRRHQRQGHGRAVVAQLLALAASNGHHQAALSYDTQNTMARSLYASMAFIETGELTEDGETVARKQLK